MRAKEIIRIVAAMGAEFREGNGSHLIIYLNGHRSVVPRHGSKDLGVGLVKAIERQLGVKF